MAVHTATVNASVGYPRLQLPPWHVSLWHGCHRFGRVSVRFCGRFSTLFSTRFSMWGWLFCLPPSVSIPWLFRYVITASLLRHFRPIPH